LSRLPAFLFSLVSVLIEDFLLLYSFKAKFLPESEAQQKKPGVCDLTVCIREKEEKSV
jgi:hypothetical protein